MAKDSSFDVVSQVDMQEVDNAYQQTVREISQRYDLKDSGSEVALSKPERTITIRRRLISLLGRSLMSSIPS